MSKEVYDGAIYKSVKRVRELIEGKGVNRR